ncbi:MAG TPA: indolepyruvate oxidoreductase subunit beta [Anaerolineales bacterium]|nr:indolepyruvate oxidoreductase subunit beta [Anaerolineales bacterium]
MRDSINFLLAGVGGQGTILASDVLVNIGLAAGYQAKQAEVHGMSQRGGSVTSFVRWGKVVYSPLVGAGEVDVFLAFEKAEALRNLNQLRQGALALVNLAVIEPVTVTSGGQSYPTDEILHQKIAEVTSQVIYVDGEATAQALGNIRAANVVLLGALSALMQREGMTGAELPADTWLNIIIQRVPAKYVELNRQAFATGREAVLA